MELIFYDFEVFPLYWCVTFALVNAKETIIIEEDRNKLCEFYESHREDIFIGYNSRNYDAWIMKAILAGFEPYQMSQWIITQNKKGYQFSELLNQFQIYNYDIMDKFRSLKQLEGFMGHNIRETPIDFTTIRPLTEEEKNLVKFYNEHDVQETMEVFFSDTSAFEAQLHLIKEFNLPMSYINKTQANLVGQILGCVPVNYNDEWSISFVPTLRISKYASIWNWYKHSDNFKDGQKLNVMVSGVVHSFGLGGLHGAIEKFHGKGLFLHVDVESMYPSIMIKYDLLSRSVLRKELFKEIYDTRMELKRSGKKKEQAPYKIILNSMFGISNAKFYDTYDPRRAHEVCINGQLLILDLIEHLEGRCQLIQSNTDGLIIKIEDTDAAFRKIDDACFEWENRTGLKLSFDFIKEIYQKDVNNYLWISEGGEVEVKGSYVKQTTPLDNDLPIINTALREYMINKISVEETINAEKSLLLFQKIVRLSNKYESAYHGANKLLDRTFRVFASRNIEDSYIGKRKSGKTTIEKFANTPEHCFIVNDDITTMRIPDKLDKKWYCDLAIKRLSDFGINYV